MNIRDTSTYTPRTQYGFKAKTIDIKDEQKNVIGQKIVYSFAKYTRDALPNATYLGFTGTPIEKTDVNTPAVFGNYVDIYDISQAVEDGATVKIYYESRLAKISKHHTTKEQRRALAERMKDPEDELKLVIVRDMWLTGFDVPCLHTMYIDKSMKGHTLMQAISRVNRVYKDKPGGLVVDYLGIASDLKEAVSFYSDSGGKGDPAILQEQAVQLMLEKLEIVSQMFHGFSYEHYFRADTSKMITYNTFRTKFLSYLFVNLKKVQKIYVWDLKKELGE